MSQLYWLCRAFGIVRGCRKFFTGSDFLSEWEISMIKWGRKR